MMDQITNLPSTGDIREPINDPNGTLYRFETGFPVSGGLSRMPYGLRSVAALIDEDDVDSQFYRNLKYAFIDGRGYGHMDQRDRYDALFSFSRSLGAIRQHIIANLGQAGWNRTRIVITPIYGRTYDAYGLYSESNPDSQDAGDYRGTDIGWGTDVFVLGGNLNVSNTDNGKMIGAGYTEAEVANDRDITPQFNLAQVIHGAISRLSGRSQANQIVDLQGLPELALP